MIYESDLFLLQKIFLPEVELVLILDPKNKTKRNYKVAYFYYLRTKQDINSAKKINKKYALVNLSGVPADQYPFEPQNIQGVISLEEFREIIKGLQSHTYYYIENPYETIRWIFPGNLRKPAFLEIYDQEAEYARAFRWFVSLFTAIGKANKMADHKIQVLKADSNPFPELPGDFDSFSIFCGRFLFNGKIMIQLVRDKEIKYYVKYALEEKARKRIRNEAQILEKLEENHFRHFRFPESQLIKDHLSLTNIIPEGKKKEVILDRKIYLAIDDYYQAFLEQKTIREIFKKDTMIDRLSTIHRSIKQRNLPSGISPLNITEIYREMSNLLNQLPVEEKIPVSLAHNDFTEWNISTVNDMPAILDWEEAGFGEPLLTDIYEFLIHKEEQEDQPSLDHFLRSYQAHRKDPGFLQCCEKYKIKPLLNFKIFILLRFTRLMVSYVSKNTLPYQLNFKLYFWKNLLITLNKEEEKFHI